MTGLLIVCYAFDGKINHFSSFSFKNHATICLNHILMAGCRYHARFRNIFFLFIFLGCFFHVEQRPWCLGPNHPGPGIDALCNLGSSIEKYLTTRKNREHIETYLFCYANALHFLSVQLDSGQFQENSQEYVR